MRQWFFSLLIDNMLAEPLDWNQAERIVGYVVAGRSSTTNQRTSREGFVTGDTGGGWNDPRRHGPVCHEGVCSLGTPEYSKSEYLSEYQVFESSYTTYPKGVCFDYLVFSMSSSNSNTI
ncbi:hypothetical protein OH76DRAFT_667787 [Lentinus brumalis]|uniref:Uncharacterized protein n=1 Tax=Lentinus brumalis TaxID=2498619 RepID=A0A371D757_9APHY|nr:hypothetical protein OH76DRAFT_667787 [Polyporus brumalis]